MYASGGVMIQGNTSAAVPATVTGANNGVSVKAKNVVLGNDLGDLGHPALIISDREIPFGAGGFNFIWSDAAGETLTTTPTVVRFDNVPGDFARLGINVFAMLNAAGTQGINFNPGQIQVINQTSITGTNPFLDFTALAAGFEFTWDLDQTGGVCTARLLGPGGTHRIFFQMTNGFLGIDVAVPTARLHLPAGVAAVSGAPFKYTAGILKQTVVENGAKNFDGTNESLAVGGVTYTMAKTLTATAALNFPNTLTSTSSDLTIALVGAVDGDAVILGVPIASLNANSCYTAFVSAADTVTVRFNNYSLGAIDPASGTFRVSIVKY